MNTRTVTMTALAAVVLAAAAASPVLAAKKPKFALQTKAKATSDDVNEQSILANIENQKMILDLEDATNAAYPEMVVALADFYWDLSEIYFKRSEADALEQGIYDAEEANDTRKLAGLKAKKKGFQAKQRGHQEKTISHYRDVIRRFPNARKIAEIRYYLGYHLYAMGRTDEGVAVYTELILQHPDSPYVPDALVNIGEYYFERNAYTDSLKLYEQVEQYPDAPVLAYAVYKQAWCHYNLGAYDQSLSKMLSVLKLTKAQHDRGVKGAFDLMEEARNELVFPYSKIGKPSAAIKFFERYATEQYLDVTARLAALYTEQTEYAKSTNLLRALVKEARTAKIDGVDAVYMVIRFQRQIVDNAHRRVDKPGTVAEVQELIRLFQDLRTNAPGPFLAKEEKEIDKLILDIATGYHNEYKSTKAQKTLEYTQLLYDEYLRLFRDKPNAYAISYNNALLMLMTGKYRAAAEEFERVIAMKPDGQYADDAGERAVIAYLKNLKIATADVKNEAEEDLKRRDLTDDEKQFIAAVDRWMAIVKRKGASPETAGNVPPARFAAAKILYNANQFDAAARRFAVFYDEHVDHGFWEDAARHVLSSYNLSHDVDNLRKWANLFEKNRRIMQTPLAADVHLIRNEFNFQECFKFEKKGSHLGAAKCFIDYAAQYPSAQKAPAAIFNAGLNFFKAKRVEKALEMQKRLYEDYSTHELAPKALYSIADIFRETTVYEQAAEVYEFFVASYKDHPLAEKALRYASIFRKTLGQYDKAVSNLELYLKRYPNPETGPRVHLDIVKIREKQGNARAVLKAANDHKKRFAVEAAGVRLQVLIMEARAHKRMKKSKPAHAAFEGTVGYFNTLTDDEIRGLSLLAVSAVAEAHFNLGDGLLRKAKVIKLKGNEKRLQAAIKQKLATMNDAKKVYEQVISYGHPGWTIAAYTQLGGAYGNLADSVENTEVPKKIRHLELAVEEYKTLMAEKAKPIRERALASYGKALKTARDNHWFNEWSERAETAIAQLDLTDRSIKESRLRPDLVRANGGLPRFGQEEK